MLSRIASLALFIVAFSESYGFHSLGSIRLSKSHFGHFFKQTIKMSDADSGEEGSLWQERVKYVDLSAVKESPSPDARELPLFLLGGAFYPEGTTFLNVFEMKYRTMMFDVAQKDDMFGYIHTNPQNGAIAEVGTMCKITERQLLDDGRQFIAVKGVSRFRVNKIAKTLPYVLAEVEPFEGDDEVAEEVVAPLEVEVYNYLKYYLRLLGSHDKSKNIVISQSTKQHRPASGSAGALMGVADQSARRTAFSFSLANMIQMQQPRESQLLLQTTSIVKRLKVQKQILIQASKLISEQLIKMGSLTEEEREDIRIRSFREDDDDTDIMPDEEVKEKMEEEKDEWDISNIE